MTRKKRLVAAFALGAGLTAAGVAVGQAQTGSSAPQAAAAPTASPRAQSTPQPVQSQAPTVQHMDPGASQPTYSAAPPPDSAPGIYLPAVVFGYARSAANCVVIGCEDGPRVGGSEPSGSPDPLPVTPGPYIPH